MNKSLENRAWLKGYACAVATSIRMEGCIATKERELMTAGGLTFDICKKSGVEEYDMEVLFPAAPPAPEKDPTAQQAAAKEE